MSGHRKHRTLEIQSRTELLEQVRDFVAAAARDFGFSEEEVNNISLAVDEACTNIIKHAYRYEPDRHIRIDITGSNTKETPTKFVVNILDSGRAFDNRAYTPPDMKEYFRKMKRGGLGIVLMKKLMDEVEYSQLPGPLNSIRLVKYLSDRPSMSA